MKLNQLRYFIEVCRWGNNVTRAADELHISQPSISNAIRELEHEFGVSLFRRANGRLHITPDGERFLVEAHELLNKAEEVSQTMRNAAKAQKKISIGMPPMIGAFLFPELCTSFLTASPDFEFELFEQDSIETHRLLRKGQIDVEINANSAVDTTYFHTKHLLQSEYCLCVHKEHPLAKKQMIFPEDMGGLELVLLSGKAYHAEMIFHHFSNTDQMPKIILRTNQLQTILSMVRRGYAASVLLKEAALYESDLIAIPFHDAWSADICIFWHKDLPAYHPSNEFIKFIKEQF